MGNIDKNSTFSRYRNPGRVRDLYKRVRGRNKENKIYSDLYKRVGVTKKTKFIGIIQ